MNISSLSPLALSVIDQYLHFKIGSAVCSVPYFNNKTVRARAAMRVHSGKGSPHDIAEEVQALAVRERIPLDALADESLKKLLVDEKIGIDCSGFAFYVLNAESTARGLGGLAKKLAFIYCQGIVGKVRCALRPIENCSVATLSHDQNSRLVSLADAQPGDFISLTKGTDTDELGGERDHMLIIHQVEYRESVPAILHYAHAVAYPEDGVYGSGIRQGTIEIADASLPLLSQTWREDGKEGTDLRIYLRAQHSLTALRRLNWFV